jgi:hypothetical protein
VLGGLKFLLRWRSMLHNGAAEHVIVFAKPCT